MFTSTDRNKKVFKKYTELWVNQIETINSGKPVKY